MENCQERHLWTIWAPTIQRADRKPFIIPVPGICRLQEKTGQQDAWDARYLDHDDPALDSRELENDYQGISMPLL
jgi:hypothetical protein